MCKISLHFYDLFLATLIIPSLLLQSNKFRECMLQCVWISYSDSYPLV